MRWSWRSRGSEPSAPAGPLTRSGAGLGCRTCDVTCPVPSTAADLAAFFEVHDEGHDSRIDLDGRALPDR